MEEWENGFFVVLGALQSFCGASFFNCGIFGNINRFFANFIVKKGIDKHFRLCYNCDDYSVAFLSGAPMDYIFLIFAAVCFSVQFAFNKLYEGSIKQTTATALALPLTIGLVGVVQCYIISGFVIEVTPHSFILAIAMAAAFVPCYVLGIKVLSYGSLAIYSMFMMLGGMLVPFSYGVFFLGEDVSVPRAIGSVLLAGFIIMQALIQNSSMAKSKKTTAPQRLVFLLLCIAIFFLNGMTGVIAKMHETGDGAISEANFTFLYSAVTAVISFVILAILLVKRSNRAEKISQLNDAAKKKPLFSMIGLGLMTNTGNFLLLMAAANLPASVQFPIISGGVILLSALVSAFIFKEKLSAKEWLAVLGASLATILFLF